METGHNKKLKSITITNDGRIDSYNLAELLNITLDTLYVWRTTGKLYGLLPIKIGKRNFYYYEDVIKWIKNRENNELPAPTAV